MEDYSKDESASGRFREAERRLSTAETDVSELASAVRELTDAIRGPANRPEDGLLWKVAHLDSRRRVMDKIALAVVTAGGIGLAGFIWQLGHLVK
jgi:hypothetical protein